MFLWWYTEQNDTVYAVHYKGLIEYYVPGGEFFTRRRAADVANLVREFFQERREALQHRFRRFEALRMHLRNVSDIILQLGESFAVLESRVERAIALTDKLMEILVKIAERAEEAGRVEIEEKALEIVDSLEDLRSKLDELETGRSSGKIMEIAGEIRDVFRDIKDLAEAIILAIREEISEGASDLRRFSLILGELKEEVHPPIFPFFNGVWELIPAVDIKDSNGDVIGLSFAFNLTEVRNPEWKFAEGNIMIKCRLYYVPVEESSDDLAYTVGRGEMKMDFLVRGWQWNIDKVTETVEELRSAGINITAPNVERAGLALWLDLTSAEFEGVRNVAKVGETFEEIGNTSSLKKTAEEMLDHARDLIEAVGEGHATLSQAVGEVQREITAESTDWAEVRGTALEVMDKSVNRVVESLADLKGQMAEALSYLEETPGSESCAEIGNELISAVDYAAERLRSINETLTGLLDVHDGLVLNETLGEVFGEYKATFEELRESLVEVMNELRVEAENMVARIAERARATRMSIGDRIVALRDSLEEDERPIGEGVKFGENLKMGFATDDGSLAGWFKFVNASKLTYPDGSTGNHAVRAAYLEAGSHLRLYMIYPYFDDATLEHDPSIGLDVQETTSPEAQEPEYTVTPPSGDEILPSSVEPAAQSIISTGTVLPIAGAVAVVITAAIIYLKRR